MNWKTLALAGTATFALMTANAAFAQNGTTDTAPAATPSTTTTDTDMKAPDAASTDAAAKPAKKHHRHKHKMKAAMSQSQEEQTTADLNRQQAQNPGSTPSGASPTTSSGSSSDMSTTPSSSSAAPSSSGDSMDNSSDPQKPLRGGQESTGTTPAPADHGNASNPAAQSDKMGNGTMNDMKTKTNDMQKDMKGKKDDATTPPPSTTPMP